MGKREKEHKKKVAARNARIKQQKSAMQKAFDTLLKAQMEMMAEKENLSVDMSGNSLNFELVDVEQNEDVVQINLNQEESEKINKEFEEELPTEE